MAQLPTCPKCNSNAYLTDKGVGTYIRQHKHCYYCELCKHFFSVPMGPEVEGKWLMTFWASAFGSEDPKEFVAIFETTNGEIHVNSRRKIRAGYYKYKSSNHIPVVKLQEERNPMSPKHRLRIDNMDFSVIDFCSELEPEAKQNPLMKGTWTYNYKKMKAECSQFDCNHENIARGRAQYLQSILNRCKGKSKFDIKNMISDFIKQKTMF